MEVKKLELVAEIEIEEWMEENEILENILSELPLEIDVEDIKILERMPSKIIFEITRGN